ncbi:hypothetical protein [Roseateles agri]|uniref:hypothetical protein n=1 Tax=Roseateles agri TaxID=3098619 RepID=UPI002A5A8034|nr:hypothetical protein [Paucibacter sp. R3-3]
MRAEPAPTIHLHRVLSRTRELGPGSAMVLPKIRALRRMCDEHAGPVDRGR